MFQKYNMGALFVAGAAALLFAILTILVFNGTTHYVDEAVLQWVYTFSSPVLDSIFEIGTELGGIIGSVVISIILAGILILRKRYTKAGIIIGTIGLAMLLTSILKLIFERPRPDLWEQLVIETSFSFPSGHATASSALAFAAIVACWHTRWRWLGMLVAVPYMLFVGLSRLYLGVHFPSDVLGGWLVSLFSVSIIYFVVSISTRKP